MESDDKISIRPFTSEPLMEIMDLIWDFAYRCPIRESRRNVFWMMLLGGLVCSSGNSVIDCWPPSKRVISVTRANSIES